MNESVQGAGAKGEGGQVQVVEGEQGALAELKERLRRLRVERRLSMAALERRAELGHTTVSRALNGPTLPSEATVVALSQALGTDPGPLLALRRQALPPASLPVGVAGSTGGGPDAAFEDRYRRYVVERHGQLSVVGLDLSRPERACWPLDAAYLSLELATATPDRTPTAPGPAGPTGMGSGVDVRVERAEQALAGRRRTLVRGLAGSGKTTLLQWLAVATGRQNVPPDLAHLIDCLPFVLPLRTLVRRGQLPAPQDYLAAVDCPLDAAQPSGWADRVLAAGRALLLIDGLDEVPQAQRAHTRAWLRELLAAYPQASFLVTTRPSAVPEGWLADCGFTELTVRPMNARDVAVFVTRWHTAAAAGAATDQERAHLAGLEEALKDAVRAQRDLARMATTPLLCALVCALHRDRRGHLPQGRMELYEAALSMLLVRRDRERDIDAPEDIALTEHQSIQLLQRLAYWLIRNGQTEMDHETALALIDDALPAMPHVAAQGDAADVLTHLLGRSGLLRAPTAESVDFVHRTFQDYLGAKAVLEARDLPLLVRHAHDDQWEDVLRMAVAHARPTERAVLLRRLVARGDRTPKHRTRLHLLATACLEHATELDPAVRQEVQQRTAVLLPPRSFEEAEILAGVGPVILDLLPGPDGLDEEEAEAVVRTAGLIGGNVALTTMKRFRSCTKGDMPRVLQAFWNRFDTDDYAREVLSHIPGLPMVTVTSPEQLTALHQLKSPREVFYQGDFSSDAMTAPLDPKKFQTLRIQDNSILQSLDFIRPYKELTDLFLHACPNVVDLAKLADSSVGFLSLLACNPALIEDLESLPGLKHLGLDMELPYQNLGALPMSADLTSLFLGSNACAHLTLHGITRWPHLTQLSLTGPIDGIPEIAALPALESVFLYSVDHLSFLEELPSIPQVQELYLTNWKAGNDLELVRAKFPQLRKLSIDCYNNPRCVDLSPLCNMSDLAIYIRGRGATRIIGTEHFPDGAVTCAPRAEYLS